MERHRRAFHTLDGLRGVAALLVVTRHVGVLATGVSFPESFLAVDLFFLLSGFVIAYAYDDRLARPGFVVQFLGIRLIRLYPLYVLGLAVGVLYRSISVLNGTEGWTAGRLGEAVLLGVLLVPTTPLTAITGYALDRPTWTLLPEIVANMIYAVLFRWFSKAVLAAVVLCGAAGLVACRLAYGTLDAGWKFDQLPILASRLAFSFFGGVLLFKLVGDRRRTRPWAAWLCVAGVAAVLSFDPPEAFRPAYELVLVLGLLPLAVWVGCQCEPGHGANQLFRFLGLISYAVYVLHQPAGALFSRLLERGIHLNMGNTAVADACLALFVVDLIVVTWLIDLYYDVPVRRWLSRRWAGR